MSEEKGLTPYETREILFYKTENGEVRVEILLFQENLWLTQAKMAELFEVQKAAISKHLKKIFESGELSEDSVVSKMETTAADGKRYQTNYYNLDAIIAVGYRVNSKKATMFRIWANKVLKEFIIKGYVMDDARLREPESFFGKDYFEEQLERIRDIRASERRFYQKITDIYSQCSADYDVESPITKEFFATVQNKLHYTRTGLLFHGWDFNGRHNFAQARWARGNSWYTAGLVDYLSMTQLESGVEAYLFSTLEQQVKALEQYQADNGLWHTIIDRPDTYLETSASSAFAYGILKAVREGKLSAVYERVGLKAAQGVLDMIAPDGTVQGVSAGTPVFRTVEEYNEVEVRPMPYGQSMALLMLAELIKH